MSWRNSVGCLLMAMLILLTSCAPGSQGTQSSENAPFPTADPTLMPVGEVTFIASAPQGTPPEAELVMVIMDEVTGWGENDRELKMEPLGDGRWQVKLNPPAGSLLRYRYVRLQPSANEEAHADGSPVATRLVHLPASGTHQDRISAWAGSTYQGSTGRLIGRLVEAETGLPLPGMLVNVSGHMLTSDGTGGFRVDYLPPGEHRITALSPDGSHLPAQQGAIIAAGSTTPAEMQLMPAKPIQVTFELTVPADTLQGTPIRLAGNLAQLGHTFATQPGSSNNAVTSMPTFIEVDPTHYLLILNLYAGTDLRYKYTLGDGKWNAERDSLGALFTRQTILPNEDILIRDAVAQWGSGDQDPLQIWVTTPAETPADDKISIQINDGTWNPPVPMWRLSQNQWFLLLYGPFNFNQPLRYRYCRNMLCGKDLAQGTAAEVAAERILSSESHSQTIQDQVDAWRWWTAAASPPSVGPYELNPRQDFEAGVELMAVYQPDWQANVIASVERAAEMGVNAITLTPTWVVERNNPTPLLAFDPSLGPTRESLQAMIDKAQSLGLQVVVRPELIFPLNDPNSWWTHGQRDATWWDLWYTHYRRFILTYAEIAANSGVDTFVLGGAAVAASMPEGTLIDGSPANTPPDAALRWEGLINELRGFYQGTLAIELAVDEQLQPAPIFIDRFDTIHLHWRAPLATQNQASLADMQTAARARLDDVLASVGRSGKELILSVEYLSVDGGATACARSEEGYCLPTAAFDLGAEGNPALSIDLGEQTLAIHALFSEAYPRLSISGFYLRGFNSVLALRDKSASVRGKPAGELLQVWYTGITGVQE